MSALQEPEALKVTLAVVARLLSSRPLLPGHPAQGPQPERFISVENIDEKLPQSGLQPRPESSTSSLSHHHHHQSSR